MATIEPLNQANGQVATTAPAARPTHRPPRSQPASAVRPAAVAEASAATSTRLWMVPSPDTRWMSRPAIT